VAAAVHLEDKPFRPPLRVSAAQLADRGLNTGGDLPRMLPDLVAALCQSGRPLVLVAAQPGMHALAAHSVSLGDFGHRSPGLDFEDGPVSLLGHAQLPQHEREC
jgi:hypothetical protein